MASYAKPDEFDPENEEWSAYVERMELFFEAHDVEDEKQVATLLSSVGASTYGLLRNLVQPLKPKDKDKQDSRHCVKPAQQLSKHIERCDWVNTNGVRPINFFNGSMLDLLAEQIHLPPLEI